MLIRLVSDLRFVIGVFFGILALILLGVGAFLNPAAAVGDINLNLLTGAVMAVFSCLMVTLALRALARDAAGSGQQAVGSKEKEKVC
jgi:hypothetical protein